jgi:nucleoid-associated protein YgaU
MVIGSGRASSGQGPVCDRCGRPEPDRFRFCPDCELFVCGECWDAENGVCLSSSRPNLPAPGLLPISIRNTIGQRSAGVSLSATRAGQALVGPAVTSAASQARAPVAARARPARRKAPTGILAVVVASLLITVALFAFPALVRLLAGGPQASGPPAVATTEGGVQGGTSSAHAARRYVVRRGDTLRSIAARFYGDEGRWADLYRANRKAIDDPDSLEVGTSLTIP